MIAKISIIVQKAVEGGLVDDARPYYSYMVADSGITLAQSQRSLIGSGATQEAAVRDLFDQMDLDGMFETLQG